MTKRTADEPKTLGGFTHTELRQSADIHRIRRAWRKSEKALKDGKIELPPATVELARKFFESHPEGLIPWPSFDP